MTWHDWDTRRDDLSVMVGKTFTEIVVDETEQDFILFKNEDYTFEMTHQQDCCESVWLESIDQDIQNLVGQEILEFTERIEQGDVDYGTYTWTFYHIKTARDTFVLHWKGESNGYYGESVDLFCLKEPPSPPDILTHCVVCGGLGYITKPFSTEMASHNTCTTCKGYGRYPNE